MENNNCDKLTPGQEIIARRKYLKKTTRQFAEEYGLSTSVLNLLEHDKIKKPSMNTLSSLTKALDKTLIDVCKMYGIETPQDNQEQNSEKIIAPQEALMKALLRYGLDPSDLEVAIRYIDFLRMQNEEKKRYGKFM